MLEAGCSDDVLSQNFWPSKVSFLEKTLWVKILTAFLEKMTNGGHKVIDTVGFKHLSSISTFFRFDLRHPERSYPIFSIFKELH